MNDIVIIGGGHAAAQLCASLVEAGQGARVHLVCEEPCEPYHRPPLSKAFLKSAEETTQPHKAADWYREAGITLHLGNEATAIDRAAHTVTLRSGAVLPWERLVLATGTRARRLSGLPDGLANVATLRAADEAHRLRTQLASAQHVIVLGGGFIGLEVAATAKAMGKTVRVVEAAPRLMGRAVSPELSAHVLAVHRAADIDIVLNAKVGGFEISGDRLQSIEIDGVKVAVDLLLLGIGAVPETTLAEAAGLECADGIVVDAHMQTSDAAVLAIGDCTRFPDRRAGRALRLESVANANEQARTAAATLTGAPRPHDALPWFWSEQGGMRLQMVGLVPDESTPGQVTVRRPGPGANPNAFSLFHYVDGQLVCVESANAPVDHMMSRKLMEAQRNPEPAAVADVAVPLKSLLGS
ncbi:MULTISPECIES: NAD(P)/FAD-dependent oxidoreductase [unclassified Variovorax]|uniref:NAD(P)/FAD-dependent oxidoreductase n=1 Tax=unclassified Variovorax TaxID=663243 RepID=UPI002B227302|nr:MULTISPECIES: FAD-dependent oxidoreductase [unclassified Variovorax]MEB0056068.1 FAD-dependent oxidoreductase [Variovorax sp. LG9.2]MEB0111209.1 FAD-dependent oxidoreductase [Variovorax sp. RTB1]